MLSISQIKFLKSLHKKKFRKQHGKIILEGHRLILQAVTFGAIMEKVWITDEYESSDQFKEIAKGLKKNAFDITSQQSIKKMFMRWEPRGYLTVWNWKPENQCGNAISPLMPG